MIGKSTQHSNWSKRMKTKSAEPGQPISAAEVTNISPHGFCLLIDGHEHFVAFEGFPWFRNAAVGALCDVQLPTPHHLYWPQLDIDLAVESLDHPERFPLVSKAS